MTKILAIGSPKGGVGKSTQAAHQARIAADAGLKVLLVDADANHTVIDWESTSTPATAPFDVTGVSGEYAAHLAYLPQLTEYDLIIIDLPGAREGAFRQILAGHDGNPIPDLLLMPTTHMLVDIAPCSLVLNTEVIPLGLPHLLVLGKVPTHSEHIGRQRGDDLRDTGLTVAKTLIRAYSVYGEAYERGKTVLDIGGPAHQTAREAETEQLALAAEIFESLDLIPQETNR